MRTNWLLTPFIVIVITLLFSLVILDWIKFGAIRTGETS